MAFGTRRNPSEVKHHGFGSAFRNSASAAAKIENASIVQAGWSLAPPPSGRCA